MDNTQKLQKFRDAVSREAQEKAQAVTDAAQRESEERIKTAREKALVKGQEVIREEQQAQQRRVVRQSSLAQIEAQRTVLLHREEAADSIFEAVKEKLAAFRESNEYKAWLIKAALRAKKTYEGEQGIIFLANDDMKYSAELKGATGFDVQARSTILYGGLAVSFENINAELDFSFDCAIERERHEFCRSAVLAQS